MIGCMRTRVRKQPIIALYFKSENELKFITSRPVLVRTMFHSYDLYRAQCNKRDSLKEYSWILAGRYLLVAAYEGHTCIKNR